MPTLKDFAETLLGTGIGIGTMLLVTDRITWAHAVVCCILGVVCFFVNAAIETYREHGVETGSDTRP